MAVWLSDVILTKEFSAASWSGLLYLPICWC